MKKTQTVDSIHDIFLAALRGDISLKVLMERGEELRNHAAQCTACDAKRQEVLCEYNNSLSSTKRQRLERAMKNLLGTLGRKKGV
jgi:hypothetical protein